MALIFVPLAMNAQTYWGETTSITTTDTYLIGLVDGSHVYLVLNYNPSNSNHYYHNSSYGHIGYTALATIDGNGHLTGCSGNTTDLQHAKWKFGTAYTCGKIAGTYDPDRYLYGYTSDNYNDCYPNTSSTVWSYNISTQTLSYTASSITYYLQLVDINGTKFYQKNSSGTTVKFFKEFTAPTYPITATANPSEGGTIAGTGYYAEGATCTLIATPNTGYNFVSWTDSDTGQVVSTNATYSFLVSGETTLVANFVPAYTITATANPAEGGSVTGDGNYNEGQSCTLTATANEGYSFTNWTENDTVVSDSASYTFTVTADRDFVANFELQTVTISVTVDPDEGGTVTGDGTFNYGEQVTLVLTPAEDHAFQNWTENDSVVSTSLTYTFQATANRNLVAHLLYTEGVGEQENNIMVYPNPTSGAVTVEGEGLDKIRIVNAFGQTVYNAKAEGNQVRIDLSQMANGVYVMHIGTENGVVVKQIVVR